MRRRKRPPPASRRVRAPFSPTPPLPALPHELHTPQSAPGCVAHTHSGFPTLVAGGTRWLHGATARVRYAFSPRDTPSPAHTRPSQLHMAHPAPHTHPPERHARRRATGPIRASRCVCLLCTHLSAASALVQRPATAKPHRPLHGTRTALCSLQLVAHGAEASRKKTALAGPRRRSLVPLARPFCRTALGSRSVPTASCATHCTPLAQRPPETHARP